MSHRWNLSTSDKGSGHFERSRDDGKTWERCTRNNVMLAIGWATMLALRQGPALARPAPRSQWGLLYRYVTTGAAASAAREPADAGRKAG